jgi:hypothetical protein
VIADPSTSVVKLTTRDEYIVIASDGLHANSERGGGGGLTNDEVCSMLRNVPSDMHECNLTRALQFCRSGRVNVYQSWQVQVL